MTEKIKTLSREKFNEALNSQSGLIFNQKYINACFEYWYVDKDILIKLICKE